MFVRITKNRQVEFPEEVLDALGVIPGDQLEIEKTDQGFILHPRRLDLSKLGTLRHLVKPDTPPFDIHKFRETPYDPSLRD